eukprot:1113126-Rhodomonas_salina.1
MSLHCLGLTAGLTLSTGDDRRQPNLYLLLQRRSGPFTSRHVVLRERKRARASAPRCRVAQKSRRSDGVSV